MTKKQAQLLNQIHETVKQTSTDVDWVKRGIRVNGSSGLEPILKEQQSILKEQQNTLKEQSAAIQDLKPKVGEVYEATAKIRSTFKFTRAFKEFLNSRPILKKISETIIGKVVVQLAVYLFWLTITLAGFDLAIHTIKNAVEMLIK